MLVSELIECLEKCDVNAAIFIKDDYGEEYDPKNVTSETSLYENKYQKVMIYI